MRPVLFAFLLASASPCLSADFLQEADRTELVLRVLERGFWGHAVLRDGSKVHPKNDLERRTVPISLKDADAVIGVGEVSGLAKWCGLEWRTRFLALTANARERGFTETQVAFIGVLHGAAQGTVYEAFKSEPCGEVERDRVLDVMSRASGVGY